MTTTKKTTKAQPKAKKITAKKPTKTAITPHKKTNKPTPKSLIVLWGGIVAIIFAAVFTVTTLRNDLKIASNNSGSAVLGTSTSVKNIAITLSSGSAKAINIEADLPFAWSSGKNTVKWDLSGVNTSQLHVDVSNYNRKKIRIYSMMDNPSVSTATQKLRVTYGGLITFRAVYTITTTYLNGIDAAGDYSSNSVTLGSGTVIKFSTSCYNTSATNTQVALLKTLPSYLTKVRRIRFIDGIHSAYAGLTMGDSLTAIDCEYTDVDLRKVVVHEMAHAWDSTYNPTNKDMYISEQADWTQLYSKYKKYMVDSSYTGNLGRMEFFAKSVEAYYFIVTRDSQDTDIINTDYYQTLINSTYWPTIRDTVKKYIDSYTSSPY